MMDDDLPWRVTFTGLDGFQTRISVMATNATSAIPKAVMSLILRQSQGGPPAFEGDGKIKSVLVEREDRL
jgi:hypothetical protein